VNAPRTDDGILAWEVIRRCAGQVRAGPGGAYALDFGAILTLAEAMGALNDILVDLLPEIEPIVIRAYQDAAGDDGSRQ
jgi:hypothetical protein